MIHVSKVIKTMATDVIIDFSEATADGASRESVILK
jgi:hypothetical protein